MGNPTPVGPATKLVRAGGSVTIDASGGVTISPAAGQATTLTGFTAGSVLFTATGGAITQDNANFYWDDTANFLGVGYGSAPLTRLHVKQTSAFGRQSSSVTGDDLNATALVESTWSGTGVPASGSLNALCSQASLDYTGSNPGAMTTWVATQGNIKVPSSNATGALANTQAFGGYFSATNNGTGGFNKVVAAKFDAASTNSGTTTLLIGNNTAAVKSGTGAVTTAYAYYGAVQNTNATGTIAAGTVFYAAPPTATGVINYQYGLYVDNQSVAGVGSAYAIGVADSGGLSSWWRPSGDIVVRGPRVDVRSYGTQANMLTVADGYYNGTNADRIASAATTFTVADASKYVVISGAAAPTSVTTGTVTTTAASTTVTVSAASFTQNDVGKWILVPGARASIAITNVVGNGTTATVTTGAVHGLVVNDQVTISGNSVGGFNTTFQVATTPTSTTFTVASATNSTGTGGTLSEALTALISGVASATTISIATPALVTQAAVALSAASAVRYAGGVRAQVTASPGTAAYLPLTTSAIANTYLTRTSFSYASDDAAAIQAAINATPYQGVLYIPSGNYCIAATLTVNRALSIVGNGPFETNLWMFDAGTSDCLQINHAQSAKQFGLHWRDFAIYTKLDHTAGAAIRVGNVGQSIFSGIKIGNSGGGRPYDGIYFNEATEIYVDNFRVGGCANNGITLIPRAAGSLVLDLTFTEKVNSSLNLNDGVKIWNNVPNTSGQPNINGIYFQACTIYLNYGNGISLWASYPTVNLFFRGTMTDSNRGMGMHILSGGAGATIDVVRLEKVWASYNGNPVNFFPGDASNIYVDATTAGARVSNLYLLQGHNIDAGRTGISLLGNVTQAHIANQIFYDNGQGANATHPAIYIGAGVNGTSVTNNRVYNTNQFPNRQNGIQVDAAATDLDITNNWFDVTRAGNGSIASGSAVLTVATATFNNSQDVSKGIKVAGAGVAGADLTTTISALTRALTSITRVGTTATATLAGHGYSNGDLVAVSGTTPAGYTGSFYISNVTANTFDYVMAADPGGSATVAGVVFNGRQAVLAATASTTVTAAMVSWSGTGAPVARNIPATLPVGTIRETNNVYESFTGRPFTQWIDDGLGSTVFSDVIGIQNTVPATAGVPVQQSPGLRFSGHAWNTTATAADNFVEARVTLIPASAAAPTGKLSFAFGVGAAANPTMAEQASIDSNGVLVAKKLAPAAGTTTVAPLVFTAGTNLTAAAAGAFEYDGAAFYTTADTTNGRRVSDAWNYFRLTGSGTGITTIADFFGSTSAIPLVANGVYEIEWFCYFSQATAGIATWTVVTATTALANLTGEYIGSPIGGIGTVGTPQTAGINVTSSSSTAFPVTGTEATAVTHRFYIRVLLTAGNGASNVRLRLTMSAGTATPLINSFFRVRRLPGSNTGAFVA